MEIKPNGAPRFARSAIYQLESYITHLHRSEHQDDTGQFIPMLVSSYLSPESRSICLDHNVAYLDLYGNARLAFGPVYIERSVPERPKSEARAQRSLFTPRAGAILRVLLRDPARAWRVTDLAEAANASLGHVSNVRKALLDREWVEIREDGLVLVQPDALLKSWRENYRQPRRPSHQRIHGSPRGPASQSPVGKPERGTATSARDLRVKLGCRVDCAIRSRRHAELLCRRTRGADTARGASTDPCRTGSQRDSAYPQR